MRARCHYNFYRTYDPATGRYLESDPIGLIAGLNTYAYVGNVPTMRIDPFGLHSPQNEFDEPLYVPDWLANLLTFGAAELPVFGTGKDIVDFCEDPSLLAAAGFVPFAGTLLKKLPVSTLKNSPFGPKIADPIPTNGVPDNWTKGQIDDAISDYQTSIASRKSELAAFDAAGRGNATQRLAHAQRITQEEAFLRSLIKAQGN